METERLSVEDAKRRHLTMKPKQRARYAGFYYKKSCANDALVDVKFLFGSVEFAPDDDYISFHAPRQMDDFRLMFIAILCHQNEFVCLHL